MHKKKAGESIRLAQVHEVDEDSLLRSFSKNLRRSHNSTPPLRRELGIVFSQNIEHAP
jgi:hypothetical protein